MKNNIWLLFLRVTKNWLLILRLSIVWLLVLRMIRNSCFWYNYNENHQTFQFWLLILRITKNLAVIPQNDKIIWLLFLRVKNYLAASPQTDKTIWPLILRMKNNFAVNPQIEFHFVRNAKYLGFDHQNGKMILAFNPQSVKYILALFLCWKKFGQSSECQNDQFGH